MGSKSGTPTSAGVMVVSPTSLTARPPGQPGIGRCRRDQPAGDPASLAADHYACDAPAVTAVIVAFGGIRVPTVTVYAIELSLEVPGLAGLADRSTSQSLLALACRPPPRGTRSRRSAARHRRAAGWRRWLAPPSRGHRGQEGLRARGSRSASAGRRRPRPPCAHGGTGLYAMTPSGTAGPVDLPVATSRRSPGTSQATPAFSVARQ